MACITVLMRASPHACTAMSDDTSDTTAGQQRHASHWQGGGGGGGEVLVMKGLKMKNCLKIKYFIIKLPLYTLPLLLYITLVTLLYTCYITLYLLHYLTLATLLYPCYSTLPLLLYFTFATLPLTLPTILLHFTLATLATISAARARQESVSPVLEPPLPPAPSPPPALVEVEMVVSRPLFIRPTMGLEGVKAATTSVAVVGQSGEVGVGEGWRGERML